MAEHSIRSVSGITIRLTDERWVHISEGHPEMAGSYFEVLEAISEPDVVVEGNECELIAVRMLPNGKFLVVVYRETEGNDGFVITAFLTRRASFIEKRKTLWERQK